MRGVALPALALAGAALPLTLVDLGRRVIATNDEARFPLLAADVLARGAWLQPQLAGEPYLLKPPLTAWLIALASWPAGHVTALTATIPTALAAIALAFVVWALGRELFGASVGLIAGVVVLTSQGVIHFARVPLPDMPMTCLVTTALWMFARMTRAAEPAVGAWLGCGFFAALAFWSKGPAGLLLPTAVAIAAVLVDSDLRHRWSSPLPALAVALLLVAPWWVLTLFRSGSTQRVVVNDYVLWYVPLAAGWSSLAAPIGHVVGILLPWVLVLPAALYVAARHRAVENERRALTLVLIWLGVTFVLVALSREQRFRYYLPVVPPAALAVAWWLQRVAGARRERLVVVGCLVVGAIVLGVQHAEIARHNAVNEYARLRPTLARAAGAVVAWDVHQLALTLHLGRRVAPIGTERELVAALTGTPPGVAVVKGTILATMCRRDGFDVIERGRLADRDVAVLAASPRLAAAGARCRE